MWFKMTTTTTDQDPNKVVKESRLVSIPCQKSSGFQQRTQDIAKILDIKCQIVYLHSSGWWLWPKESYFIVLEGTIQNLNLFFNYI